MGFGFFTSTQKKSVSTNSLFVLGFFVFCFGFWLFRVTATAYGGSQARGRIRPVAAGPCHSHGNMGSMEATEGPPFGERTGHVVDYQLTVSLLLLEDAIFLPLFHSSECLCLYSSDLE